MASQGERVLGVVGMCDNLDSMVQDEIPEQEMLVVEEQELPRTDPEPEMGVAAAAESDIPPPHLRQIPSPAPGESTPDEGEAAATDPPNLNQLLMGWLANMQQALESKIDGVNKQMETSTKEIKTNACRMSNHMNANIQQVKNGMKEEMEEMRGEMQSMGRGLQAGMEAMAGELIRTTNNKGELIRWNEQAKGECGLCRPGG